MDDSVQNKNRTRKRPNAISKMEKSLGIVMDKFEEKRLKLTQELERSQEIEERRQEHDRQHELHLWGMLCRQWEAVVQVDPQDSMCRINTI